MIPFFKKYILSFFTDEAVFQRFGGILISALGSFLATGAVIPGTDHVVESLAGPNLVNLGKLITIIGVPAILAGGASKNGGS